VNDPPLTGIQVIQVFNLSRFLNPLTCLLRQPLQILVLRAPGGTWLTIAIPAGIPSISIIRALRATASLATTTTSLATTTASLATTTASLATTTASLATTTASLATTTASLATTATSLATTTASLATTTTSLATTTTTTLIAPRAADVHANAGLALQELLRGSLGQVRERTRETHLVPRAFRQGVTI
jgi:hypothetical protein